MGDISWAWGGDSSTTRSSTSSATHVNRGRGGTGMPQDRGQVRGRRGPLGAVNITALRSWEQYVRDTHEAERMWGDDRLGEMTSLTQKKFRKQSDIDKFNRLQASVRRYQQNQTACSGGSQAACNAVGRTNRNDRPIYNQRPEVASAVIQRVTGVSGRSSQDYWNNRTLNDFSAEATPSADTPGDIMGDGTSTRPSGRPRSPDPQGGASGLIPAPPSDPPSSAGGRDPACVRQGPGLLAAEDCDARSGRRPPRPESPQPHRVKPEEHTGEQVPETHDRHDDQQHRNPHSGGGTHSGRPGDASHTGSEDVVHFDSGAGVRGLARQANPVRETLNKLRALVDPYGEFRQCKTEKRLVE